MENIPIQMYGNSTELVAQKQVVLNPKLIPVLFILTSLALYWPTRDAGFVMDWLGWQAAYNRAGWAGVPGSFGYPGLHPVLHLGNYLLYWLFGANSPIWYGVFAIVHGLNAWLLFRLALRLPVHAPAGRTLFVAFTAGVLFLLSPYAAEVVVWRVCLHYLLALLFAQMAMHRTLDYLHSGKRRDWWQIQLFFALGLFSFEWSLVVPVLLLILVVTRHFSPRSDAPLMPLLGKLFAPQAGLLALYFLINKLRIGDWVGHYGAETHLNFQPRVILATMFKYVVKQFGFARHWEHAEKTRLFDGLEAGWPFWLGAGLLVLGALVWLVFFRRANARIQWAGAAFAWFFVALLPVSNLYFCYLQLSENDRYGYFATGFGWLGFALLLSFLPKIPARLIMLALLVLSLHLLAGTNRYWAASEQLYNDLVQDFRWYDRDEVIILASPDNYHGVFMLRIIGQPNGFNEALEMRRGRAFAGNMWEVAQFNVSNPSDGVKVEKEKGKLLYKVSFRQDGNWWWRNGIGATDYENDRYLFRMKEWHVEVELKEKRPKTVVIYPDGGKWVEVK
jgi:hypothetical protein